MEGKILHRQITQEISEALHTYIHTCTHSICLDYFFFCGLNPDKLNYQSSQKKKKKERKEKKKKGEGGEEAGHKAVKSKQLCLKAAEISLSYPAVSRYCKTYGSPLGAVPKQWEMLHPICAAATGGAITR